MNEKRKDGRKTQAKTTNKNKKDTRTKERKDKIKK